MNITKNNKLLVCDLSKKYQARTFAFIQNILNDYMYSYLPISYPFKTLDNKNFIINYDLIYKKMPSLKEIDAFNLLLISLNDLNEDNFLKIIFNLKIDFKKTFIIFYDYVNSLQNNKKIIDFLKIIKNDNYMLLDDIETNLLPNSFLYWKIVSLL